MRINYKSTLAILLFVMIYVNAQTQNNNTIGIKLRIGGRYDDVRMCIASPAGVKGGIALEVSLYSKVGLTDNTSIAFEIPVFRPILFGLAFKMLQFDPDITLLFNNDDDNDKINFVAGPTLGVSVHYGPDYKSDKDVRSDSFFAIGPRIGGFLGLDFKKNENNVNFQLGVHPYVTPLFTVNTNVAENGIVAGATLDGTIIF